MAAFKEQSALNMPLTLHSLKGPWGSLSQGKETGTGSVFVEESDSRSILTEAMINLNYTLYLILSVRRFVNVFHPSAHLSLAIYL